MRRLFLAAALPVLAGAACDARHGAGASPFPAGGRFLAERVAGRTTTLIDGPGWATYCPTDSSLVIIAIGRTWSGGLALRAVPPLGAAHDFRVEAALGDTGTATAAFRSPDAGAARLGLGGTVRVTIAAAIDGSFDVTLPDSGQVRVVIRGRLTAIPLVRLPTATCSPP